MQYEIEYFLKKIVFFKIFFFFFFFFKDEYLANTYQNYGLRCKLPERTIWIFLSFLCFQLLNTNNNNRNNNLFFLVFWLLFVS